jgi:hypothetical protein
VDVIKGFPPNYDEIKARFAVRPTTIYAYGDTIYSPSTVDLPADLIAHEQVHFAQQKRAGGPDAWWRRYLDDPQFRLSQEVEAYRAQYQLLKAMPRADRRRRLAHICGLLASGMYGRLVTKEQARALVTGAPA